MTSFAMSRSLRFGSPKVAVSLEHDPPFQRRLREGRSLRLGPILVVSSSGKDETAEGGLLDLAGRSSRQLVDDQ